MIRNILQPKAYGEAISYFFAVLIYGSSAWVSAFQKQTGDPAAFLPGKLFVLILQSIWLHITMVVLAGVVFSFLVNQFCKNHKILGAKTNIPILISSLSASLMFQGSNVLPWLLISIFSVFLLNAVFNAQEQEKDNLSGILFVGTLMFISSIINPITLWFIPVVLFTFGLFLFFSLKRFTALFLAFALPLFILWSILLLTGNNTLLIQHFSPHYWFFFRFPEASGIFKFLLKIVFLIPFILGWLSLMVHYGQNAAKQRKIQSVVLFMGVYLFPISELTGSESTAVQGLSLIPLVLANSAYFTRSASPRLASIVFFFHLLAWAGLRFFSHLEPFLNELGLV